MKRKEALLKIVVEISPEMLAEGAGDPKLKKEINELKKEVKDLRALLLKKIAKKSKPRRKKKRKSQLLDNRGILTDEWQFPDPGSPDYLLPLHDSKGKYTHPPPSFPNRRGERGRRKRRSGVYYGYSPYIGGTSSESGGGSPQ